MLRIFAIVAVLALTGTGFGVSSAQAQKAGTCSVEKCVAACTKNGGRWCDRYCQNEISRQGCRR
jgi:hypothetical protein